MIERNIWLDKKRDGVTYTRDMAVHIMMSEPDIVAQPKRIEEVAAGA